LNREWKAILLSDHQNCSFWLFFDCVERIRQEWGQGKANFRVLSNKSLKIKSQYMESPALNVFIVDDNRKRSVSLWRFLKSEFAATLDVSLHFSSHSMLHGLHSMPDVIILNFYMEDDSRNGENGIALLREFKLRYPESQVLILTSNEAVSLALEVAIASRRPWYTATAPRTLREKVILFFNRYLTQPVRILVAGLSPH
jgi:CheY-like chemotaxis protein